MNENNEAEKNDYPDNVYLPLPATTSRWEAVPRNPLWTHAATFLAGILLTLGTYSCFKAKAPPPPATPTFQVAEIGGCQFLIFSNPFFVLHWPKCFAHPGGDPKPPTPSPSPIEEGPIPGQALLPKVP